MAIDSDGPVRRSRLLALVLALALTSSTSCALLSGSESEEQQNKSDKLEKSVIKVATMEDTSQASFHVARMKGYFEREGLTIKHVVSSSGVESSNKLLAGDVDIAFGSYTPFVLVESKGVMDKKGGLKLVAGAGSCAQGSTVVVATESSRVRSVQDLAGKKVAVPATGTLAQLLVQSAMKNNDVSDKDVKWVTTPFPSTAQALKSGRVDAAFATEPFIQDTMKRAGARPIADLCTGPTADLPVTGYASSGDFAEENPKTIAAFQRGMQRGANYATAHRTAVDKVLVEHSGVDKETAKVATLLSYTAKLDATTLQRTPDLMYEFGLIKSRFDISDMIVPTAPLR